MIAIEIRSNIECSNREIREFAEQRIRFALDRFRGLRRIVVSIQDVNGPRGGRDKACRVVAEFDFANVIVEEVQEIWQSSLARALRRVAQNAARKLRRVNHTPCRATHRTAMRG
jgi:putative sigma-54 modulation protein